MKIDDNIYKLIFLTYFSEYNIGFMNHCVAGGVEFVNLTENGLSSCMRSYLRPILAEGKVEATMKSALEKTDIAIHRLRYDNIEVIPFYSDRYPKALRKIADKPPVLYLRGELQDQKMAAVVGSRKTSQLSSKITENVVGWLNDFNYGVTSGLAAGIDTFAHKAALSNNQYTIAVLPKSLDSIYPKENYSLAADILDAGGALVSELIYDVNRGAKSFVQRNRIQAALSEIVIPIEFGLNSGTMHTISFAKRYKKKLMMLKPTPSLMAQPTFAGNLTLLEDEGVYKFENEQAFKDLIVGVSSVAAVITALSPTVIITSKTTIAVDAPKQINLFDELANAVKEESSLESNSAGEQQPDPPAPSSESSENIPSEPVP